MRIVLSLIVICFLSFDSSLIFASPLDETRYCGEPNRNARGEIIRRADVRAAFRNLYPCPSTGLKTGACTGWQIDHVRPLASCGCDSVSNLQWLPVEIKTCSGTICKDRWERKVYTCEMK